MPLLLLSFPSVGFEDDKQSSYISRAHTTNSTCLTNGLRSNLNEIIISLKKWEDKVSNAVVLNVIHTLESFSRASIHKVVMSW